MGGTSGAVGYRQGLFRFLKIESVLSLGDVLLLMLLTILTVKMMLAVCLR